MLGCRMAGAAPSDANQPLYPSGLERRFVDRWQAELTPWAAAFSSASNRPLSGTSAQPYAEPLPDANPALSPAAVRVGMIASGNGDRVFLMVDKAHGRIILFENGRPVFNRAALTGESLADRIPPDGWNKSWSEQDGVKYKVTPAGRFTITRIPPDGWNKSWSEQDGVKYKVTPAGRFTITRDRDQALGDLFDINELEGKDWVIAIHQVWLGRRSEHRDARLRSTLDQDKHITAGCVDVDPSTIAQLWRLLPSRGMPLYILPTDESLIAQLFPPRGGTARPGAPQS